VSGMDNVSEVNAKVELTDWKANGSTLAAMDAVGMEEVCVVEVMAILVGGGVSEVVVVAEADGLI
ncbi:hypothetical protein KI387_021920, partial [Taxus chinensis]